MILEDKILRNIFYSMLFTVPLVVGIYFKDTFDLPKMAMFQISLLLIFVFWVLKMIKEKVVEIKLTTGTYIFIAYLLIYALTTLLSIHKTTSFYGLYNFYFGGFIMTFCFFLFYFIMSNNNKIINFDLSFKLLSICGSIVALYGILQYFGIEPLSRMPSVKYGRVWSSIGQPNYLGAFLIMLMPFMLEFALSEKETGRKVLYGLTFLLSLICLGLTLSRASWIGFAVSMPLYLILKVIRTMRRGDLGRPDLWHMIKKPVIPLLVLILLVGGLILTNKKVRERFSTFNLRHGSTYERTVFWSVALKLFKERPLLGFGPDTYEYVFLKYQPKEFTRQSESKNEPQRIPLQAHNEILNNLVNIGAIGTILYLLLWYWIIYKNIKVIKVPLPSWERPGEEGNLNLAVLSSNIALFIQNLFAFSVLVTTMIFLINFAFIDGLNDDKARAIRFNVRLPEHISVFILAIIFFLCSYLIVKPVQANYFYTKGLGSIKGKNYPEAEKYLIRAIELRPVEYYRISLAEVYKEEALKANNVESRMEKLNLAMITMKENLKANSLQPANFINTGASYMWFKQFVGYDTKDEAMKYFKKALELRPNHFEAYLHIARVYMTYEDYEFAVPYFDKALEILPEHQDVLYEKAFSLFNSENYDEAEKTLNELLKLNPEHKDGKEALMHIEELKGRI